MAIRSSSGPSLISGRGHFTCFTNTQHDTTEDGRKKNKPARTWVCSKRKKREVLALFCGFLCICGYCECVSERNSHTAARNAGSSSRVGWPGFWVHWSQFLLQQPPLSDYRLSPTVANSSLLMTALGPCLSSSSSSLVGNLARKPSVWVSRQSKQKNPLTGDHPHPQKRMTPPPSCHRSIGI